MALILLFISFLVLSSASPINLGEEKQSEKLPNAEGTFWQFTDIHWDLRYDEHGNPNEMCHQNKSSKKYHNGYFGNYLCDSPWTLVQSSMMAMQKLQNKPNFILWTGDNAPHSRDPAPNFDVIFPTISNLTKELRVRFSEIPIIPVLGNHDAFPKDYYPDNNTAFYEKYLNEGGWSTVLNEEAQKEFLLGGYFSSRISPKLSVLSVNTNLYYAFNGLGTKSKDPAGQFAWMLSKFEQAKANNEKVILAAHAPPGFWERNGQEPFFNASYNNAYVNLLNKYGDVILAQFYGHEHTDSFRLFNSGKGKGSVAFLAPSLTPWRPIRLLGGTAINPSVRLYSYNSSDILDYHQYHLNLTEANKNEKIDKFCHLGSSYDPDNCEGELSKLWHLYYQARTAFSVAVLNVDGMNSFLRRMQSNDSILQMYYRMNSAGVSQPRCDNDCKRVFLCAITNLLLGDFRRCDSADSADDCTNSECFDTFGADVLIACIFGTVSLTVVFVIMLIVALARRNKSLQLGATSAELDWPNRNHGYKALSGDGD